MTAKWITADVFDGLASLEDGSVDLVVTSPPFLALRSYLSADHPDKHKEIGSEATPAEFIDVLLRVTAELRRVLAPQGSICVELGDTYAGSGGGGGDYYEGGLREGQPGFTGPAQADREAIKAANAEHWRQKNQRVRQRNDGGQYGNWPQGGTKHNLDVRPVSGGPGWPLSKSRTLIPQLYEIALAYGVNPLTGQPSPAGQWRIRNVVTWARPNPPVGALGDKWRPATSDLIVACTSSKRYWDDLATRKPYQYPNHPQVGSDSVGNYKKDGGDWQGRVRTEHPSGAPLLDYWEIPPGGYKGSHYAVFPEELVVPCVKAMCPEKVCRTCGEPSRRITDVTYERGQGGTNGQRRDASEPQSNDRGINARGPAMVSLRTTTGWTDCGHDDYRPGLVLDPFAGSGTTLSVATGHGHDAIGIDLDARNAELARDRIGPFLFEEVTA